MRADTVLLIGIMLAGSQPTSQAQRTRFPGDSPTRLAVMNGRVLGTPSGARPNVPTFTIPQRGYRCGSYGVTGSYSYFGGLSTGFYGGAYPLYCHGCGHCGGLCACTRMYPAVVVDYRAYFGPRALAANQNNVAPLVAQRGADAPPAQVDLLPPAPKMPARVNASKLQRAWRYIDLGDRYLREGRLRDAHTRYRKAAAAAPHLPMVRFRQAFVELALGNIDDAAEVMREGLQMAPDWAKSRFDLKTVYSEEGQRDVLRQLKEQLAQRPNDADGLLLSGVMNHFGGAAKAAQQQFEQAVRVTGGESVARLFLDEQPEAKDAAKLLE